MTGPADTGQTGSGDEQEDTNAALIAELTAHWKSGVDGLAEPVLWSGYPHGKLWEMMHSLANDTQVNAQLDRLQRMADKADEISTRLGEIFPQPEIWSGEAASRSAEKFRRHRNGGFNLATFLGSMAAATSAASEAFRQAQGDMPEPPEGGGQTWPVPPDNQGLSAEQQQAKDRAVEVMQTYERNLRDAFQLIQLPTEIPPGQPTSFDDSLVDHPPPEGVHQAQFPSGPGGDGSQTFSAGNSFGAPGSAQRSPLNGPVPPQHGSGEHPGSSAAPLTPPRVRGSVPPRSKAKQPSARTGNSNGPFEPVADRRSGRVDSPRRSGGALPTGTSSASSAFGARPGPIDGDDRLGSGMNADGWRELTGRGSPPGAIYGGMPGGLPEPGGAARSGSPYRLAGTGEAARRPGSSLTGAGNAAAKERDEEDKEHRNRMPQDEQLFTFSDEPPIAPPVIGEEN